MQPPGIVIFDLNTDKLIRRFTLPPEVLRGPSLANLAVDVTAETCDDAYAYIPDLAGYGLIVYNFKRNEAWRVTHNYFYLEPLAGEFTIGGNTFQWNDGIFSVELSKINSDNFRNLYFHSMAGTHMYMVSTRILKDRALATRSYHGDDFKVNAQYKLRLQSKKNKFISRYLGIVVPDRKHQLRIYIKKPEYYFWV